MPEDEPWCHRVERQLWQEQALDMQHRLGEPSWVVRAH
jgi:hypothetical protein